MEGFAQQQITQMSTYDQLLVEIAEKNQKPLESKWSPEVRLCMMMSLNIVLFVVSRMIFKKTGHNLLGTINSTTIKGFSENTSSQNNMKEP
jgi:capsular polysaccharide biosynthesis protein